MLIKFEGSAKDEVVAMDRTPLPGEEILIEGVLYEVTDTPVRHVPHTNPIGNKWAARVVVTKQETKDANGNRALVEGKGKGQVKG